MKELRIFVQSHIAISKYISEKIFEAWNLPKRSILFSIFIVFLFLIIMSIAITTLVIFYIYKKIVTFILYQKIGSNFISLLTGINFMASLTKTNGVVISNLMYFDSEKPASEIMQEIQEELLKHFKSPIADRKLFALTKQFMGYMYFEEFRDVETSKLFQCVRLDTEDENIILHYCNEKPLPYNGKFCWDMTLFIRPEISDNGKRKYTLVFRIQHFVVDGLTLFNIIKVILAQYEELEGYGKNMTKKLMQKAKPRMQTSIDNLTAMILPHNIKISNSSPSNSRPLFNIYLEPTKLAIPKLKQIREIFPGTTLVQLILTAYSASLANYFLHNTPKNIPIPETFNVVSPLQTNPKKFSSFISNSPNLKRLNNDFTFTNYSMPIIPKDKNDVPIEDYIIERMNTFKEEFLNMNNSMNPLIIETMLKTYCEVLPVKILQLLMTFAHYNVIVSIFPGGSTRSLFTGDVLKDILFSIQFMPERANINIFGFTYDDRLQFIQVADPVMFENKEEFEKVLPNIFKYVDILHTECLKHK